MDKKKRVRVRIWLVRMVRMEKSKEKTKKQELYIGFVCINKKCVFYISERKRERARACVCVK